MSITKREPTIGQPLDVRSVHPRSNVGAGLGPHIICNHKHNAARLGGSVWIAKQDAITRFDANRSASCLESACCNPPSHFFLSAPQTEETTNAASTATLPIILERIRDSAMASFASCTLLNRYHHCTIRIWAAWHWQRQRRCSRGTPRHRSGVAPAMPVERRSSTHQNHFCAPCHISLATQSLLLLSEIIVDGPTKQAWFFSCKHTRPAEECGVLERGSPTRLNHSQGYGLQQRHLCILHHLPAFRCETRLAKDSWPLRVPSSLRSCSLVNSDRDSR